MKFVLFDKLTGDVTACIDAPSEKHALAQEDDVQGVLAVDRFPDGDHVVQDGKLKKGGSAEKEARKVARAKQHTHAQIGCFAQTLFSHPSGYSAQSDKKKIDAAREYFAGPSKLPRLLKETARIRGVSVGDLAAEWAAKALPAAVSIEETELLCEKYRAALANVETLADIDALNAQMQTEFETLRSLNA